VLACGARTRLVGSKVPLWSSVLGPVTSVYFGIIRNNDVVGEREGSVG
jgi:hypothetical protein